MKNKNNLKSEYFKLVFNSTVIITNGKKCFFIAGCELKKKGKASKKNNTGFDNNFTNINTAS